MQYQPKSECDDICFGRLFIATGDGRQLAASCFRPAEDDDRNQWVIIASAMGVKRNFYRDLAETLAADGYGVLTFDYRGIGDSAPDNIRREVSCIEDWGCHDLESVIRWLRENHKPSRLFLLGHSVGGQIIGLAPSSKQVDGIVLVASQHGYWRNWHGRNRALVWGLWYLFIPVLTTLCGFFPARHLGLGENLPRNVARQWAEWGRDPAYLMKPGSAVRRHHRDIARPGLVWCIDDDWLAPRAAVLRMIDWYRSTAFDFREIGSADEPVGHWGWFRPATGQSYWAETVRWMNRAGETG